MRQKLYFKIKNTESPNSGVSSTIHKIQYDNKAIVTVSFHSGNKYEYLNVPEQIYDEAEKANQKRYGTYYQGRQSANNTEESLQLLP